MEDLLNRGQNFSILPLKLDLTQVLVDFKYFERTMIWKEFWYGRDQEEGLHPKIFNIKKRNLPKNYKSPNQLKTFLGAVKSELTDSENRNPAKCNLPPNQLQALKELIQLQKDRKIILKKCDKGAGIIILNFEDYMTAANEHLMSEHNLDNGEKIKFYSKVDTHHVEKVKTKITKILQEAFDNDILTNEEYEAMNPNAKNVGKFYMNFKVHKPHDIIPPGRPIVSGCNSMISNIGKYVDFHINDISTAHPSYLQDTPHFIRMIENINKQGRLPDNTIIVTWDVISLYTIIPQKEGLDDTENVLNKRNNPNISTSFLIRLLEIVLSENIFEFSDQLYKQNVGTSMGTHPAPAFANNFMAKIDIKIWDIIEELKETENINVKSLNRFLDDLISIFIGSTKTLHKLWQKMNEIHPSVKFTMQHTTIQNENVDDRCDCDDASSVPYLDTSCSIKNGQIILDLYRKPTDRNRYLLPDSCHPYSNIENIPLSLAIRITRICSETDTREKRYSELKDLLMERNYPEGIINSAVSRARNIPRSVAIMKVARNTTSSRRPVFVVSWDPRLPSVSALTNKHWRSMIQDPLMGKKRFENPH